MRRLFASLERRGVEYPLISGQATVHWGELLVVHPRDLVELKKTRRLADYDIITNLAVLTVAEQPRPGAALVRWAARNCFRPEERAQMLARLGRKATLERCARRVIQEVARLQARDRLYWSKIIDELRQMRRSGELLPDGVAVSDLARAPSQRSASRDRKPSGR